MGTPGPEGVTLWVLCQPVRSHRPGARWIYAKIPGGRRRKPPQLRAERILGEMTGAGTCEYVFGTKSRIILTLGKDRPAGQDQRNPWRIARRKAGTREEVSTDSVLRKREIVHVARG